VGTGAEMSEYPDPEVLEQIAKFPVHIGDGSAKQLLEIVAGEWSYPDYVSEKEGTWTFATGGWSGNEDLIAALQENTIAWMLLWWASERGGKFTFKVRGEASHGRDD
jgi:hypothetical protein